MRRQPVPRLFSYVKGLAIFLVITQGPRPLVVTADILAGLNYSQMAKITLEAAGQDNILADCFWPDSAGYHSLGDCGTGVPVGL